MVTRIATSVLFGAAVSACAMAQAATLDVLSSGYGTPNAGTWAGDGYKVVDTGGKDSIRAGVWEFNNATTPATGDFRSDVFVFKLPSLNGEQLTGAQFANWYWNGSGSYNVNAAVLGVRSTPDILASDYNAGALLNADFATPSSEQGVKSLSAGGQSILLSKLQPPAYVAGSYLFIALNTASEVKADGGYNFSTQDRNAQDITDRKVPFLTLTTAAVPEPALLGLAGLAVVGLLGRRRARRV